MASTKNEAKVTFTAETSEFTKNINNANSTIKNLNSDLKLADAQFKNSGDSAEYYSQRSKILNEQLEANQQKQDNLTQKLEVAKKIYGEDSTEVDKLETSLNYAKIQEENLTAKISECNNKLYESKSAAAALDPEMQALNETIAKQESELTQLKADYAAAVSEIGEADAKSAQLSTQIDSLTTELGSNQAALAELDAKMAAAGSATADYETKAAQLKETIAKQESELAGLKNEYSQAATESGQASQKAEELRASIDTLSGNLSECKSKLQGAETELGQLGAAANDAEDDLKEIAGASVASAFSGASELAGGVTDKLKEMADQAIDTAAELETATAKAAAYLGLTGEDAEANAEIIQRVYEDGWGDSLESVSDAIVTVRENLGDLNDTDLETVTTQALALEDMGVDMSESMRGVNQLMTQFGLSSTEAMDLYVAGINGGLNYTDELGDNIAEYAGAFADAGYSADEYFQLLENGSSNGSYNLDKVNDAINEATTRLEDGTIEESLSSLSTGTQDVFAAWQNGEATQKDVIESIVGDISNCTDEQEKLNLMALAFGTMGEDGNEQFITSLTAVGDSYSDVEGSSDQMTDTLSTNTSTLEGSMRELQDAIAPIGEAFQEFLVPIVSGIAGVVGKLGDLMEKFPAIKKVVVIATTALIGFSTAIGVITAAKAITSIGMFASALNKVKTVIAGIGMAMSANPIGAIITIIGILIPILINLYNNCEPFRNFVDKLIEVLQGAFMTVMEAVKGAIEMVKEAFKKIAEIVQTVIGAFSSFLDGAKSLVKGAKEKFASLKQNVTNVFGKIKEKIVGSTEEADAGSQSSLKSLKSAFSTISGKIKTIAGEKFGAVKESVVSKIQSMRESSTEKLNTLKSKFSEAGSTIKETFGGKIADMKESVIEKVSSMKEKVSGMIQTMKGFFNFTFTTPKIKLPHFSISPSGWKIGDLLKGTIPTLSVKWYAKGGVAEDPTMLGLTAHVAGEKGPEAIAPVDVLQGYIADAVAAAVASSNTDYKRIGSAVAAAVAKQPISIKMNNREFGRAVREYA